MCWVMPPASPAATSAWRMASRSEVLPWSTWPITVTTGGRVTSFDSSSSTSGMYSSTSKPFFSTRVAELRREHGRRVGVDLRVDGRHLPGLHQLADEVGGLDAHRLGELGDRDRLLDPDDLLVLGLLGDLRLGSLLRGLLLLAADGDVGAVGDGGLEQLLAGEALRCLLGDGPAGGAAAALVLVLRDVDELALAAEGARDDLELAHLAERARPGRDRGTAGALDGGVTRRTGTVGREMTTACVEVGRSVRGSIAGLGGAGGRAWRRGACGAPAAPRAWPCGRGRGWSGRRAARRRGGSGGRGGRRPAEPVGAAGGRGAARAVGRRGRASSCAAAARRRGVLRPATGARSGDASSGSARLVLDGLGLLRRRAPARAWRARRDAAAGSTCARLRTTNPGPVARTGAGFGFRSPRIFSSADCAWSSSSDDEWLFTS